MSAYRVVQLVALVAVGVATLVVVVRALGAQP